MTQCCCVNGTANALISGQTAEHAAPSVAQKERRKLTQRQTHQQHHQAKKTQQIKVDMR